MKHSAVLLRTSGSIRLTALLVASCFHLKLQVEVLLEGRLCSLSRSEPHSLLAPEFCRCCCWNTARTMKLPPPCSARLMFNWESLTCGVFSSLSHRSTHPPKTALSSPQMGGRTSSQASSSDVHPPWHLPQPKPLPHVPSEQSYSPPHHAGVLHPGKCRHLLLLSEEQRSDLQLLRIIGYFENTAFQWGITRSQLQMSASDCAHAEAWLWPHRPAPHCRPSRSSSRRPRSQHQGEPPTLKVLSHDQIWFHHSSSVFVLKDGAKLDILGMSS